MVKSILERIPRSVQRAGPGIATGRTFGVRLGVISAVATGLIAGYFGTAFANGPSTGDATDDGSGVIVQSLPGGNWSTKTESYPGTTVEFRGQPGFRGVVEDRNLGTRLESYVQIRQIGSNSDVRGVYYDREWWRHGEHCYITSFDSPGIGCSTGWTRAVGPGTYPDPRYTSSSWGYYYTWWNLDPAGNSGRLRIRGGIDVKFAYDQHTSWVLRGANYG